MTDAELGMELYVVVGNALNLLLHGMDRGGMPGCDLSQQTLVRLEAATRQLGPGEMLSGVGALNVAERKLLAQCCRCALTVAAGEVDTVLGAPEALVEEVAQAIEQI